MATLELPNLTWIMNDPTFHSLYWLIIPTKLLSNILKFNGSRGEDSLLML